MRYALLDRKIYPVERETARYVWVNSLRWEKENSNRNAIRRTLDRVSKWDGKTFITTRVKLIDESELKQEQERLDADMVIDYLRKLTDRYSNNLMREKHSDAQIVEVGYMLGILHRDNNGDNKE